jgi:hypothetical protein
MLAPEKGFDLWRHSWPDLGDPARKNGKKGARKDGERTKEQKERRASAPRVL